MHRVLIPAGAVRGNQVFVTDPPAVHHLARVLRLKPGEPVECFDGQGRAYRGIVAEISPTQIVVDVHAPRSESVPRVRLMLAQALIQPERFEWVLQKATELGVTGILPMLTARTIAKAPSEQRCRRWQRIVEEAAAQCGRATVPSLETPQRFEQIVQRTQSPGAVLMPTLAGPRRPLSECLAALDAAQAVLVMIGPEGDFSPEEIRAAAAQGIRGVDLGPLTLRSETAAIAVLAILQHRVGAF